LETIGITAHQDKEWDTRDSTVLQAFHDSFRTEDIRRVVSLPKKEDVTLPTTRHNAENRFKSLETRLRKNVNLRHVYYTHMLDYMQRGQVEVVDQDKKQEGTFYLPRHAVSKGKGGDTKWRIVFDASSHERGVSSLNDALEKGPNLLPELFEIVTLQAQPGGYYRRHTPSISSVTAGRERRGSDKVLLVSRDTGRRREL
jgi:hypothetical protein